MERQTKIRGQKYQGKGFSLSGFVFSPHQNSGYFLLGMGFCLGMKSGGKFLQGLKPMPES